MKKPGKGLLHLADSMGISSSVDGLLESMYICIAHRHRQVANCNLSRAQSDDAAKRRLNPSHRDVIILTVIATRRNVTLRCGVDACANRASSLQKCLIIFLNSKWFTTLWLHRTRVNTAGYYKAFTIDGTFVHTVLFGPPIHDSPQREDRAHLI